jgi:molybdate transport system regulatory protein
LRLKLRSKIWLEGDGKVFGDGPCDLLQRVERLGSLRQAAAEMKMSYAQAWELVKMLEDNLGTPLLEKKVGGPSGGGSVLTKEGRRFLQSYTKFRQEADEQLQALFKKYF